MNCDKTKELLYLSFDKELGIDQSDDLKKHLLVCKDCELAEEKINRTGDLLNNLPKLEPPLNFTEQVMQKLAITKAMLEIERRARLLPLFRIFSALRYIAYPFARIKI